MLTTTTMSYPITRSRSPLPPPTIYNVSTVANQEENGSLWSINGSLFSWKREERRTERRTEKSQGIRSREGRRRATRGWRPCRPPSGRSSSSWTTGPCRLGPSHRRPMQGRVGALRRGRANRQLPRGVRATCRPPIGRLDSVVQQ